MFRHVNRRYLQWCFAIGYEKQASCRSTDFINVFRLISGRIVGICSILKCLLLSCLFNFLRLMIVLTPPDFLGLVKILDKNWDSVGVTGIIAPLQIRVWIFASMQEISSSSNWIGFGGED